MIRGRTFACTGAVFGLAIWLMPTAAVADDAGVHGLPQAASESDNDHLFTVGDIVIPHGDEASDVGIVGGALVDPEHLVLIVRNNRDVPVFDINISIWDPESSGQEVIAEFFIPNAGLAPGDWIFGQNVVAAPGLGELGRLRVGTNASDQPGDFVELEVTSAEVSGDTVVGMVTNTGVGAVGNFNIVSVACFNQSAPTAYAVATLGVERLGPGESAQFRTDPIDPAACPSFAAYAIGLPAAQSANTGGPTVTSGPPTSPSPLDGPPTSVTEQGFADAFMEQAEEIAERAHNYVLLAADALADDKLDEAALYAQLASDSYGAMGDLAVATPGVETPLGQLTVTAMQTCEQAWSDFSREVRSFDNVAFAASVDAIQVCQTQIADAMAVLG